MSEPPSFAAGLWRAIKRPFVWLAALVILFEEWGWEPLARLAARLARLPFLAWLERRIAALPPYAALAVFFVPALALLPIKLLAVWGITRGHKVLGLAVIVTAKLVGTAIVARLFQLTQASLMQLAWFAALHGRWSVWKAAMLAHVRASAVWRGAQALKQRVKAQGSRLWSAFRGR